MKRRLKTKLDKNLIINEFGRDPDYNCIHSWYPKDDRIKRKAEVKKEEKIIDKRTPEKKIQDEEWQIVTNKNEIGIAFDDKRK